MAASFKVRHGGALRSIVNMQVKQLGVLRNLKTMKVMHGGSLRLVGKFVQEMTLGGTISAGNLSDGDTTNPATVTVSGGLGPYSYAWSEVSDPEGINPIINSPHSATTTFTRTTSERGQVTFSVTVTDSLGTEASRQVIGIWGSASGGTS